MSIFRDANLNVIATNGENQPSVTQNVAPQAKSVPASTAAGTVSASDYKYNDATTGNIVADRA